MFLFLLAIFQLSYQRNENDKMSVNTRLLMTFCPYVSRHDYYDLNEKEINYEFFQEAI